MYLCDLGLGNGLLGKVAKAHITKGKPDKIDFTKILNIYVSNHTIENINTQLTDGRKYLQTIYLMKDFYSELQLHSSKTNSPIKKKKMGTGSEQTFLKEDTY